MIDKQVMSSDRDNWETPQWLFNRLNIIFKFQLDCASSQTNTKCLNYITKEQNALSSDWLDLAFNGRISLSIYPTVFLNPPYGKFLPLQFLRKVKKEYDKGLDIVVLTAARTDTKFFKIIWDNAWKVLFFHGRLKFELDGQTLDTAPFPSAIAFFNHHNYDLSSLEDLGKIVTLKELK